MHNFCPLFLLYPGHPPSCRDLFKPHHACLILFLSHPGRGPFQVWGQSSWPCSDSVSVSQAYKVAGMVAGDKVEKNSIGQVLTSRNMKDLSERRKHTRCYKVASDIYSGPGPGSGAGVGQGGSGSAPPPRRSAWVPLQGGPERGAGRWVWFPSSSIFFSFFLPASLFLLPSFLPPPLLSSGFPSRIRWRRQRSTEDREVIGGGRRSAYFCVFPKKLSGDPRTPAGKQPACGKHL